MNNNKLSKSKSKSYSPSINRKLEIKKLQSLTLNNVNICNDLLKINLGTTDKPKCYNYDNKKVIKYLLNNLKSSKYLNPDYFIAPKQLYGNCWFNTMYVSFFFSDKGRKFFRFFRELMIKGEKVDGSKIEDIELRKLFFILNLFIEATYNQQRMNKTIKKNKLKKNKTKAAKKDKSLLYNKIRHLTNKLETNFFIKIIHDNLKNKNLIDNHNIPNIDESGNPIDFYKNIIKYLNYDTLKISRLNLFDNANVKNMLTNKFENYNIIPDIIVIDDLIQDINKNITKYDLEYEFYKNSNKYKYKLDSIILTNKSHFKPNTDSHFVSVCTINNKEYKFDGDSYSRLSRFKWKNIINKNVDWYFRENPKYETMKYNFTCGYKMMFYYRTK